MKKVLVVDDNEDILDIISTVLDMEGYEVRCADNGYEVPDTVLNFSPDVILLDIMLDGLDGRDICKKLKSDPATSVIPIIMISASHNLFSVQEKGCMADDFVSKPFDIDHLVKKVGDLIQK